MPDIPNRRRAINDTTMPPPNSAAQRGIPDTSTQSIPPNVPIIPSPPDAGYLTVFVSTASGAIPLENALVTVSATRDDGTSELMYITRTNKSGRTTKLPLPAPPRSNSLYPGAKDPYAKYTVSVDLEGYQPVESSDLSIFADVAATLPVLMFPLHKTPTRAIASVKNAIPEHSLYPKE